MRRAGASAVGRVSCSVSAPIVTRLTTELVTSDRELLDGGEEEFSVLQLLSSMAKVSMMATSSFTISLICAVAPVRVSRKHHSHRLRERRRYHSRRMPENYLSSRRDPRAP